MFLIQNAGSANLFRIEKLINIISTSYPQALLFFPQAALEFVEKP